MMSQKIKMSASVAFKKAFIVLRLKVHATQPTYSLSGTLHKNWFLIIPDFGTRIHQVNPKRKDEDDMPKPIR
jgi:hypothetical protein